MLAHPLVLGRTKWAGYGPMALNECDKVGGDHFARLGMVADVCLRVVRVADKYALK